MALPFHKLLAALGGGLGAQAAAILASFGTDAHIYLPGIGTLNGYTLGNYLESTGNTAATVDNPVGLVLDAGQAVGAELSPDVDFNNAGAWTLVQPTAGSVTVSGGVCRINSTDGSIAYIGYDIAPIAIGDYIYYRVEVTALAVGSLQVQVGGVVANFTGVGVYTGVLITISTVSQIHIKRNGVTDATITSFSFKRVPGIHASQGTTANKPILRKPSNNYYWEFDGVNDNLSNVGAAPFQQTDDQCVIAGASRPTTVGEKYIFSVRRQASATPIATVLTMNSGGVIRALWRNDAGTLISVYPGASFIENTPLVVSARKVGNDKVCRVNGVAGAVGSTAIGATSTFDLVYVGDLSGTNYFDGHIYPIIAIKGAVSDADLLILERWVGTLTGPTGVTI